MTLKVLLCSKEGEQFYDLISQVPGVTAVRCEPSEIADNAGDIDVFFGHPSADILKVAPKLRWIQASSAGVEFVARIPELVESDVVLTNTRGAHGPSIGEHTMALLLAMTRHLPESLDQQHAHVWDRTILYRTAREIGGMTMGIIGFGALGRGIAQRAQAMELNLLAVDAQAISGEPFLDEVWPPSRLDDLLEQSDVVVVAAPLTAETRHLLDASKLAKMKKDAYLVVVSRGGIVVEEALADALRSGHLAGAAIDVVENEPMDKDHPLWDVPRLIITPHMAGASARKERRVVEIFCENLVRFQNGEPLQNEVDKARGY
ncbi:MAG TPA: D-2-hydroxyacid dehydrogenase [Thermomicrobiales bacterium]|nr:D-2-hydroxyacid dehydrogenase [Thermomicrobiales bacterium]